MVAPVYTALSRPVTCIMIIGMTALWWWINKHRMSYVDFAGSYERIRKKKEYWRIFSASVSHVSIIHLLFNMTSLWNIGFLEAQIGRLAYIRTSLLLLLGSWGFMLLIYYVLIERLGYRQYARTSVIGYSGVLFGWMTLIALAYPEMQLNLYFHVPVSLSPFVSLIMTSLMLRQVSFVGHLSGILMGYLLGWGVLSWIDNYLFWNGILWLLLACVRYTQQEQMPLFLSRYISFPRDIDTLVCQGQGVSSYHWQPTGRRDPHTLV